MKALRVFGRTWDRISIYLPLILMGLLALGTYWLARNTPSFAPTAAQRPPVHEPDYFMRGFSVRSFDAGGRMKSEIRGTEARHYPDTDTMEVDDPRIRSVNARGAVILASAKRAISNADGSQIQLIGDAVVTREAPPVANGRRDPRLEIRGEFLHVFVEEERVRSHKPVVLRRGNDVFAGDSLAFDNLERVLELQGRVRGTLVPDPGGR